eukprot:TRINITY_DN15433_c0_g1_i1.p1 TRINITY_DN15433_c0_g1~~TRINITY_DN15433_c0_g1_i1.p1  ORF type:complete len:131 (-),score=8.04 TRINITY_DN15433_c0_g1_i1:332-724(-)
MVWVRRQGVGPLGELIIQYFAQSPEDWGLRNPRIKRFDCDSSSGYGVAEAMKHITLTMRHAYPETARAIAPPPPPPPPRAPSPPPRTQEEFELEEVERDCAMLLGDKYDHLSRSRQRVFLLDLRRWLIEH